MSVSGHFEEAWKRKNRLEGKRKIKIGIWIFENVQYHNESGSKKGKM